MRGIVSIMFVLLAGALQAATRLPVVRTYADSTKLIRSADSVQLSMNIHNRRFVVGRRQAVVLEPRIIGDDGDTLLLPTVGYYGKYYYYHLTRDGRNAFQSPNDWQLRAKAKYLPPVMRYAATVRYEPWMQRARVNLKYYLMDDCGDVIFEYDEDVLRSKATIVQGRQRMEDITSTHHGTAYVDFVVNRTELDPFLHNNRRELARIKHSLDSLLTDTTTVITHINICGYASPEGSYSNNQRLASGRSQSLANYIAKQFGIDQAKITSTSVAEDWDGFRQFVETYPLREQKRILWVLDNIADPDERLNTIRRKCPADYAVIAERALPYLRHSDYDIEYQHRGMVFHPGEVDTLWALPEADSHEPIPATPQLIEPYRPIVALKTNALFDLALTPNIEVETQIAQRWSVMLEAWSPWWLFSHNSAGEGNRYRSIGQKPFRHAFELQLLGAEVRYWFLPRCPRTCHPWLTGTFVGIYGAGGRYDLEWKSEGSQGEFTSIGLSVGHAWPISRHWNLELSAAAGYVGGPRRRYVAEQQFQDTHLIYRSTSNFRYIGPTKLKLSLVWLIGTSKSNAHATATKKKGGAR